MAAEKLSHQEATQPRAAHHFSADQHADETMIFVAPALVFLTAFLLLGAASFLEAITEQVRHHQAAKAAATHHSGAYQEAHQLAFLLARTFFGSFFAFLGGLAAFLATLVQ